MFDTARKKHVHLFGKGESISRGTAKTVFLTSSMLKATGRCGEACCSNNCHLGDNSQAMMMIMMMVVMIMMIMMMMMMMMVMMMKMMMLFPGRPFFYQRWVLVDLYSLAL